MTQKRIQQLHEQIGELEERLAQVSAEYSELHHIFSPFLARYQNDIVPYHEKLVEVQRENADLRAMLGEREALRPQSSETPLTRLLDNTNLSVEEQYQRAWATVEGSKVPTRELQEPVTPALWQLYQELIPKVFPAFGKTEEEVEQRLNFFKRANFAYVKRDETTLKAMLASYAQKQTTLPAVVDPDLADKLQQRVTGLEKAVANIEGQVFEMRHGDLGKLKQAAEKQDGLLKQLKRDLKRALRDAVKERERLRDMVHS
jgi:tetrahydromethanopterin S-methyltransferase subunit G